MKRAALLIFIFLGMLSVDNGVASEVGKTEATPELSEEDMKVIKVMEILELMDEMEHLDLLKDMDLLIEEEGNENEK